MSMDDIIVREVRKEELRDVIEINLLCLPEHYPYDFWLDHLNAWGKAFLVAEVNGKVVGYVMCRVETGLGFINRKLLKLGHVVSIAVLPDYRRKGIGRKLMLESMDRLKIHYGVEEVYLEVRISNTPAIRLYEGLGFKKIKVLKHYYLDGEDAYLMARGLQ